MPASQLVPLDSPFAVQRYIKFEMSALLPVEYYWSTILYYTPLTLIILEIMGE